VYASVSTSLHLGGVTTMDSETRTSVSSALAASIGVQPSAVVVTVVDFPVTATIDLVGLALDAWNANVELSASTFAAGIAADLGIDRGTVTVISSQRTEPAEGSRRRRLADEAWSGLSVTFTVLGFGSDSSAAATAATGITGIAGSAYSSLAFALYEAGLPVASLGVPVVPQVSAALLVTVAIMSDDESAGSAAAAVGSNLVSAVSDGGLTRALATGGIHGVAPLITEAPQTFFASPPPPRPPPSPPHPPASPPPSSPLALLLPPPPPPPAWPAPHTPGGPDFLAVSSTRLPPPSPLPPLPLVALQPLRAVPSLPPPFSTRSADPPPPGPGVPASYTARIPPPPSVSPPLPSVPVGTPQPMPAPTEWGPPPPLPALTETATLHAAAVVSGNGNLTPSLSTTPHELTLLEPPPSFPHDGSSSPLSPPGHTGAAALVASSGGTATRTLLAITLCIVFAVGALGVFFCRGWRQRTARIMMTKFKMLDDDADMEDQLSVAARARIHAPSRGDSGLSVPDIKVRSEMLLNIVMNDASLKNWPPSSPSAVLATPRIPALTLPSPNSRGEALHAEEEVQCAATDIHTTRARRFSAPY
jgi:hypothetical protein